MLQNTYARYIYYWNWNCGFLHKFRFSKMYNSKIKKIQSITENTDIMDILCTNTQRKSAVYLPKDAQTSSVGSSIKNKNHRRDTCKKLQASVDGNFQSKCIRRLETHALSRACKNTVAARVEAWTNVWTWIAAKGKFSHCVERDRYQKFGYEVRTRSRGDIQDNTSLYLSIFLSPSLFSLAISVNGCEEGEAKVAR